MVLDSLSEDYFLNCQQFCNVEVILPHLDGFWEVIRVNTSDYIFTIVQFGLWVIVGPFKECAKILRDDSHLTNYVRSRVLLENLIVS